MLHRQVLFTPFFMALFPLLFLFSHNIEQTTFSRLMVPALLTVAGVGILVTLFYFLFRRDLTKSALFVAFFSILFFSYGHINAVFEKVKLFGVEIGRDRYVLSGLVVLLILVFIFFFTRKKIGESVTTLLFRLAVVLLIIPIISIASFEVRAFKSAKAPDVNNLGSTAVVPGSQTLPDIYYVILDGYAHETTLRRIQEFDNSSFLDALRAKGFFIPTKSRANYAQTHLSLASALSMEYLPAFPADSKDREPTYQLIQQNAVTKFLRSKGYRFVQISSGMVEMTDRNPYADVDFRNGRLDEFSMLAIESSALYPFLRHEIEAQERERVLYSFQKLSEMPAVAGPKFVFAHVLVPHPPFVFGPNGEMRDDPTIRLYEENPWLLKGHYIDQLKFTNKKVLEIVDSLLANSKVPPIIIFQGDHGTASAGGGYKGLEKPNDLLIKERMKIFAAYYLPGKENVIPDEITPLNSFRRIFNAYFDAGFELLPDKSFFSHYERPYDLLEVTEKARQNY